MSELAQVLRPLLPADTPDALVDASTRDDAAVYRLSPDRALVVTVDFFTPVVDDPYDFGRIGAVNALSDVYAMGARPLFVLNLVGFPRKLLSTGALEEIIRGGSDVATEAGVPILGGHSIDDPEPKYGMVALGDVHPDRIITNAGARPGDLLVLTKPLGTGVVSTAIKAGAADPGEIDAAVRSMATLNRAASEAMITSGIQAATDITGYGLLGHLRNMMAHSGTKADIRMSDVPLLPGVRELAAAGHVPGGTRRNLEDLRGSVQFEPDVLEEDRILLADAQTSGGLLMAVPPERESDLVSLLQEGPYAPAIIGEVGQGPPGLIRVHP
jgi:selenide,water dikinase